MTSPDMSNSSDADASTMTSLPLLLGRTRPDKLNDTNTIVTQTASKKICRAYVNEEFFPTTAMPVNTFMQMKRLEPFGSCLKNGLTVQDIPDGAIILFISHQWLSFAHPDPEGVQLRTLQRVLLGMLSGRTLDIMDEASWLALSKNSSFLSTSEFLQLFPFHRGLAAEDFTKELQDAYIWLDYFSVPQPASAQEQQELISGIGAAELTSNLQALAIHSIPYYIERSAFFFVVAPEAKHADTGEVCDLESWRARGWCRLEEYANYLSITTMPAVIIT